MTEKRSHFRPLIVAAVAAATVLIAPAAPVGAEGPAIGSDCPGDQIGNSATDPGGMSLRCLADEQGKLHWLPDTHAVQTLADLQSAGYSVTVDRSGDGPLADCTVVEVHNPMTVTSINYGGTSPGGPGSRSNKHQATIVVSKTIDVTLDCTGS